MGEEGREGGRESERGREGERERGWGRERGGREGGEIEREDGGGGGREGHTKRLLHSDRKLRIKVWPTSGGKFSFMLADLAS